MLLVVIVLVCVVVCVDVIMGSGGIWSIGECCVVFVRLVSDILVCVMFIGLWFVVVNRVVFCGFMVGLVLFLGLCSVSSRWLF